MIVDILEIKDRISELETLFPDVFNIESIENDLNNNPFSHYLVYLDNNKILGFINYYEIYDRLEIANFNVLDSYQDQGIGNKLIKKVMELSKDKINITLEVRADNEKAIHIYEKYGFIKKAIRKNYYNGVDGILMEMIHMDNKDI